MTREITVLELAEKLHTHDPFVLLDVREPWELGFARLTDPRLARGPMTDLSTRGLDALPEAAQRRDAEIYVLCHAGVRSAQVTDWLASLGWTRVYSVAGGIEEYARLVDPSVGTY
jgi:rhodanese-related sulfurtransferase